MRHIALPAVLFLASMLLAGAAAAQETTHEITVEISNARNQKGEMCIAIFQNGRGYPNDLKEAVTRQCVAINNLPWRFRVPAGEYAIAVLHDEDGDKLMTTRFLGVPKEGYGFSNNAPSKLGPPAWDKAMFRLDADRKFTIELTYW